MTGREKFKIIKPVLGVVTLLFKMTPRFVCRFIWHCIMPFNGGSSKAIRYVILKAKAKSVGNNLSIGANTIIKHWSNFSCGDNVSIHEFCMIDCDAEVIIGNDVSIAHASSLIAANHTWDDMSNPIKYNPLKKIGIVLKNDIWIGCGVRILDGVVIDSRSIVAAGAVVTKSVNHKSLMGGIPAKLIKKL